MKGKAIINERKRTNRKLEYLVVGSPNSDKRITCYNKTKDLENNPKPYIQDKWTAERLDYINNKVERNELRLQTSELKNIDYKQLDNREYLLSICRLHYKNFFEFTRKFKQNGKYVNKDVTPIDITFSDYNTVCLTRSKHVPSDNIIAAKGYLHKLYNSSLTEQMIQDNETDLNLINPEHLDINMLMIERHLVLFPQLVPYFERKKTTWDTEYRQKNIMYYANTDKMINDSIRIIPPVIEQEQQNNNSINKKDTDMFEMNDRLDQKVMNKMISNESEAINKKLTYKLDSNIEGKINDTNIDNIYKTYQTYITLEDKNKKLSFNQFFKVVIFCTILESKSYKLSDINKFIVDNDSEMYANNMNALIKLIIKDKLDVNGDIQLTQ